MTFRGNLVKFTDLAPLIVTIARRLRTYQCRGTLRTCWLLTILHISRNEKGSATCKLLSGSRASWSILSTLTRLTDLSIHSSTCCSFRFRDGNYGSKSSSILALKIIRTTMMIDLHYEVRCRCKPSSFSRMRPL